MKPVRRALLACALFLSASNVLAQDEAEPAAAVTGAAEATDVIAEVEGETPEAAEGPAAEPTEEPTEDSSALADEAAASSATEVAASSRAKFALVIVGDADAALQARAAVLSEALHDAGLSGVHDESIHEALLGGGDDEDGLGALRRARRTLALSDDAGARSDALERIGRASGADTLVLLARRAPTLRVYDLTARSFYEAVPASPGDVRYIASATRAAAQRSLTAPSRVAEAAAEEPEVQVDASENIPPVRAFFRKNWPYMVAGVLLAGAAVWLVVGSSGNDDAPPPVLRFRPGGAEE